MATSGIRMSAITENPRFIPEVWLLMTERYSLSEVMAAFNLPKVVAIAAMVRAAETFQRDRLKLPTSVS